MELGADDYITKPFTANELLTAISTRLAKHEVVMQQLCKKEITLLNQMPYLQDVLSPEDFNILQHAIAP